LKWFNKLFYCIIIVLVIVISSSCSSETKNIEDNQPVSALAKDNDVIQISENDFLPQDKNEFKEITYFNNNTILFDINYCIGEEEHYDYYTQNIITGEKNKVPSLADYYTQYCKGLGDNKAIIALKNISADNSRSERFTLNMLDLSNQENTLLTQWDDFYYVSGLQKLDNDTFIMYRPTDTETGYKDLIETVNIQNKEVKDFLITEYNREENVGEDIDDFCIDGEKIYVCSTHYNNEDTPKHSICIYNSNGDMLKEYNLDLDNKVSEKVAEIYKYGDYILLRMNPNFYYLFKESDDGLIKVDLPNEMKEHTRDTLKYYLVRDNLNSDVGKIYFFDKRKNIIVFNIKTLSTRRFDLEFPDGCEEYDIYDMCIDDSGKVLISIDNNLGGAERMNKFIVLSDLDFT